MSVNIISRKRVNSYIEMFNKFLRLIKKVLKILNFLTFINYELKETFQAI